MKWKYLNETSIDNLIDFKKNFLKIRKIEGQLETDFWKFKDPIQYDLVDLDFSLADLKKASIRLKEALKKKQKVLIYGDYDADGITATAVIWLSLKNLGLIAQPFIPHRINDGYGMTKKTLEKIIEKDEIDLVVSVDNGSVAFEASEFLKEKKIDLIITDHHQFKNNNGEEIKPFCLACVHSSQICGAMVAWFFMNYFFKFLDKSEPEILTEVFVLAGLATLADQMPLLGINRQIVKKTLAQIEDSSNLGLKSLIRKLKLNLKEIGVREANFKIIPCINAAGRIDHGKQALRLLCTKKEELAEELSQKLKDLNFSRKELTNGLWKEALTMAKEQTEKKYLFIISENYHEGVIGLLASRLIEKFNLITFVGSIKGDEIKVSARCMEGVDLMKILENIREDCLSLGGHKGAAGFSFKKENLTKILTKLDLATKDCQAGEKSIIIESLVNFEIFNFEFLKLIKELSPFGKANPELILSTKAKVLDVKFLGAEKKHAKLLVANNNQDSENSYQKMNVLFWNITGTSKYEEILNQEIELVFSPSINKFNTRESLQFIGKDFKKC
jgi:single-stranded-DNA-specific exonuclease